VTGNSKRSIKRRIEELETASSESVSFTEYYEYIYYCIEEHGSLPAGPTPEEFFGRELTESEGVDYWKRLIRVWDGEEEPPCSPDEWEWWST